jgi:hypothetical protein
LRLSGIVEPSSEPMRRGLARVARDDARKLMEVVVDDRRMIACDVT